ncbi:MoxR family ATPase, partial [Candidatus Woesearchaeota archaeon]|nr:MoxR family ATPase [Candidatus Woesearchaeota archaeon]
MLSEQLKEIFLKSKDPFTDILGQEQAKQGIKSALLMNRHIIIVGPP